LTEVAGGILLTLGLFTPFDAAAIFSAMLIAIVRVHLKNGFLPPAMELSCRFSMRLPPWDLL
jgi:uncharacterized membrane protein YphA (DoxX/SURF4 family)